MSTLARRAYPAPEEEETAATLRVKLHVSEAARRIETQQYTTQLALAQSGAVYTGILGFLFGLLLGGCLVVWLATGAM